MRRERNLSVEPVSIMAGIPWSQNWNHPSKRKLLTLPGCARLLQNPRNGGDLLESNPVGIFNTHLCQWRLGRGIAQGVAFRVAIGEIQVITTPMPRRREAGKRRAVVHGH